jgi:chromosome segregation ATPase
MTDDELKALVASIVVAQKVTDEQMKRTDERMKLTDEKFASLNESKKALDEQIERTEAQLEKTSRKIDRLAELYGNVSQNQGDVAEEFFLNSLLKDNHLGAIHFDDVARSMEKQRGQIQEEYDLVMTNGDAVDIVEVKYKAHINDLDKLDRKIRHFKKLFPIYQKYKQYGAIASFHINDDAKKEALKRGYFVLQRSGDLVHTESSDHLTVL